LTPEVLAPWISLTLSVIALLSIVYGWFTSGEKAVAADLTAHKEAVSKGVKEVGETVSDLERRVQALEGELRHLPDREQAHRMEIALEKLNGRIDNLATKLDPVSAIADRWQELILEQAKK
jgi:predicted  nucleic acid-binding Zn-ribbon protein